LFVSSYPISTNEESKVTKQLPNVHQTFETIEEKEKEMLKPIGELIVEHGMRINGVIHIGANKGQEYQTYKKVGIDKIVFVEPLPNVFEVLSNSVGKECQLFNTALGNVVGEVEMYVEDNNGGQSSSILEPYKHLYQYPHIQFTKKQTVPITKLDLIKIDSDINLINIDVQGYELEVFKGAINTLTQIDYIYSEVNRDELYHGCTKVEVLDEFLHTYGFIRVGTWWEGVTWGDALYIKQK
jgi:FkbM family methyltransferase